MTLDSEQIFDLIDVGDIYSSHVKLTDDQVAAAILTLATVIYQIKRQSEENNKE